MPHQASANLPGPPRQPITNRDRNRPGARNSRADSRSSRPAATLRRANSDKADRTETPRSTAETRRRVRNIVRCIECRSHRDVLGTSEPSDANRPEDADRSGNGRAWCRKKPSPGCCAAAVGTTIHAMRVRRKFFGVAHSPPAPKQNAPAPPPAGPTYPRSGRG